MRFKEVECLSSGIHAIKEFYKETLELEIIRESEKEIALLAGSTVLKFVHSEEYDNPFYHYAFNIPENQFEEAKDWFQERIELLSYQGEVRVDFPNWNAHSFYFLDPAGNIGECIARHDLQNASDTPFSGKRICNVSEIGTPVEDLDDWFGKVNAEFDCPIYAAHSDHFYPMGNAEGLFISVPLQRDWFPLTNCPSDIFPLRVKIEHEKVFDFTYGPYRIYS